jgi:hypothetical protein
MNVNMLERRPTESDSFSKEVGSLIHGLGEQAADHVDQLAVTFGLECGEFFSSARAVVLHAVLP